MLLISETGIRELRRRETAWFILMFLTKAAKPTPVSCRISLEQWGTEYSFIFSETPKFDMNGRCMYCNHCLPCPQNINIAQVSKYLDMALLNGAAPTLRGHYDALEHQASECIGCGICETQCPFAVPIVERMQKAIALFE